MVSAVVGISPDVLSIFRANTSPEKCDTLSEITVVNLRVRVRGHCELGDDRES